LSIAGARQYETRTQVEAEHCVENPGFQVPELYAARVATDSIDNGVELTVSREYAGDELSHGGLVGNVDDLSIERWGGRTCGGFQGGKLLLFAIGDDHLGALAQEREAHIAAQAAGTACYKHYFA
jgi:hypothetical protein